MPLAFPSGTLPEAREIMFRDGAKVVPQYLADLMATVDTLRYSYEEAVTLVNNGFARDFADRALDRVIAGHFRSRP